MPAVAAAGCLWDEAARGLAIELSFTSGPGKFAVGTLGTGGGDSIPAGQVLASDGAHGPFTVDGAVWVLVPPGADLGAHGSSLDLLPANASSFDPTTPADSAPSVWFPSARDCEVLLRGGSEEGDRSAALERAYLSLAAIVSIASIVLAPCFMSMSHHARWFPSNVSNDLSRWILVVVLLTSASKWLRHLPLMQVAALLCILASDLAAPVSPPPTSALIRRRLAIKNDKQGLRQGRGPGDDFSRSGLDSTTHSKRRSATVTHRSSRMVTESSSRRIHGFDSRKQRGAQPTSVSATRRHIKSSRDDSNLGSVFLRSQQRKESESKRRASIHGGMLLGAAMTNAHAVATRDRTVQNQRKGSSFAGHGTRKEERRVSFGRSTVAQASRQSSDSMRHTMPAAAQQPLAKPGDATGQQFNLPTAISINAAAARAAELVDQAQSIDRNGPCCGAPNACLHWFDCLTVPNRRGRSQRCASRAVRCEDAGPHKCLSYSALLLLLLPSAMMHQFSFGFLQFKSTSSRATSGAYTVGTVLAQLGPDWRAELPEAPNDVLAALEWVQFFGICMNIGVVLLYFSLAMVSVGVRASGASLGHAAGGFVIQILPCVEKHWPLWYCKGYAEAKQPQHVLFQQAALIKSIRAPPVGDGQQFVLLSSFFCCAHLAVRWLPGHQQQRTQSRTQQRLEPCQDVELAARQGRTSGPLAYKQSDRRRSTAQRSGGPASTTVMPNPLARAPSTQNGSADAVQESSEENRRLQTLAFASARMVALRTVHRGLPVIGENGDEEEGIGTGAGGSTFSVSNPLARRNPQLSVVEDSEDEVSEGDDDAWSESESGNESEEAGSSVHRHEASSEHSDSEAGDGDGSGSPDQQLDDVHQPTHDKPNVRHQVEVGGISSPYNSTLDILSTPDRSHDPAVLAAAFDSVLARRSELEMARGPRRSREPIRSGSHRDLPLRESTTGMDQYSAFALSAADGHGSVGASASGDSGHWLGEPRAVEQEVAQADHGVVEDKVEDEDEQECVVGQSDAAADRQPDDGKASDSFHEAREDEEMEQQQDRDGGSSKASQSSHGSSSASPFHEEDRSSNASFRSAQQAPAGLPPYSEHDVARVDEPVRASLDGEESVDDELAQIEREAGSLPSEQEMEDHDEASNESSEEFGGSNDS